MVEYGWNHPISDVVNSLISNGMKINLLKEFDYSPYNCFPNMVERDKGKFVFEKYDGVLPIVYSLSAVKNELL
jgi:hypothetical protein